MLPWAQSCSFRSSLGVQPSSNEGMRDHSRTRSFAESGLLACLRYPNWFANSVKQTVWLIFLPWINQLFGHPANTGFLWKKIHDKHQLCSDRHTQCDAKCALRIMVRRWLEVCYCWEERESRRERQRQRQKETEPEREAFITIWAWKETDHWHLE